MHKWIINRAVSRKICKDVRTAAQGKRHQVMMWLELKACLSLISQTALQPEHTTESSHPEARGSAFLCQCYLAIGYWSHWGDVASQAFWVRQLLISEWFSGEASSCDSLPAGTTEKERRQLSKGDLSRTQTASATIRKQIVVLDIWTRIDLGNHLPCV